MERLGILINDLSILYAENASSEKLAAVAQDILQELMVYHSKTPVQGKVSVIMPSFFATERPVEATRTGMPTIEETIKKLEESRRQHKEHIATLEPVSPPAQTTIIAEKEPVAEPEAQLQLELVEVAEPAIAMAFQQVATPAKVETAIAPKEEIIIVAEEPAPQPAQAPILPFNTPITSIRTVPKEIYELKDALASNEETINDKLKEEKEEINHAIKHEVVKDLKKAFNINEKYIFINELFRGDDAMFERSLKTINSFNIYPEAQYWIQRELKLKLGWNDTSSTVQLFDTIVRRRFAS